MFRTRAASKDQSLTQFLRGNVKASVVSTENKIMNRLNDMIKNVKDVRGFLERVVYPTYLKAQRRRWMSENQTDGHGDLGGWDPLNPAYARRKKIRWAAAPGGGTKMLIASGRLFKAVIGEGPGHRKIVSERSIIIGVDIPYAKHVNARRPFFIFSDEMMDGIKKKYAQHLRTRGGFRE